MWAEPLSALVRDPESADRAMVLKHSDSALVIQARLVVDGHPYDIVAKRYRPGGLRGHVSSLLGRTRASLFLKRAIRLLSAGVHTALPLATVQQPGRHGGHWLIMEAIADAMNLDRIALTELDKLSREDRHQAAVAISGAVASCFARMADAGLYHRDLKASNLLLTDWQGQEQQHPRVWIVDLDGLKPGSLGEPKVSRQPLMRLVASLLESSSLTRTDLARFLRTYFERRGSSAGEFGDRGWRSAMPTILSTAAEYVANAKLRKEGKLDGYLG
jgi:hypothetical protein